MGSSSFHVPMVLKWPKKVHFLQCCADLSEKYIKAIYLDVSESSCFALSKMVLFIMLYAMTYCFRDIRV